MPPFPNLISESVLISDTIRYLQAVGGNATAVRVVDRVMKIRQPMPELAKLLVSEMVMDDPRFIIIGENVELIENRDDHIELDSAEFIVLDVETTGAKAPPSRITEIAAFRVRDGKIGGKFHTLVNPEMPIPEFISSLTGITDEMVADAPRFGEVATDLLNFIGGSVVVAHNAQFDLGFLNYEIKRIYPEWRLGNPSICTVQLAQSLISEIENHKLKTVASYYSIDLNNHHRASDDANATAEILVNLLAELRTLGITDLGSARRLKRNKNYAKQRTAPA